MKKILADFVVKILDKNLLLYHLNNIIALDSAVEKEMGNIYGSDVWTGANFIADLNKKWEASQIALTSDDKAVCGFAIATEAIIGEFHIHRFAVDLYCRQKGVGAVLLERIFNVADMYRFRRITVEVNRINKMAISFYLNHGFKIMGEHELQKYAALRKHGIQLINNFTRESNGSESYILLKMFH